MCIRDSSYTIKFVILTMKYTLLFMILMVLTSSVIGQEKILPIYSDYPFTAVDWFHDLEDHMSLRGVLQDSYTEQLDSTILAGSDISYLSSKEVYFMSEKREIQATYIWGDRWWPSFYRTYRYNASGLMTECSINRNCCLLYTSPSPRDATLSRMPSSA